MSQSRGLLTYEWLARLPWPFIIHTDWKDETDSGCNMWQCKLVMNLGLVFSCRQEKAKLKRKWSDGQGFAFGSEKIHTENVWRKRKVEGGWVLLVVLQLLCQQCQCGYIKCFYMLCSVLCKSNTCGLWSSFHATDLPLVARDQLTPGNSRRHKQCGPRVIRLKAIGSNVIVGSPDLIRHIWENDSWLVETKRYE